MTRAAPLVLTALAWLALIWASQRLRAGELSYDSYYRIASFPLALTLLAWWSLRDEMARRPLLLGIVGLALVVGGSVLEFFGVLLTDGENSNVAGGDAWWGSDVGWFAFLLGVLVLLVAGAWTLVRRPSLPVWGVIFLALIGPGVTLANGLHEAPLAVALTGFGLYALGWLALGIRRARGTPCAAAV